MKKSLIVAMTADGVIGNDGQLPWPRIKGDLPRFRAITMGKPCIMGRKTFESLPQALDGRLNIVVSRSDYTPQNPPINYRAVTSVLEAWIVAAKFITKPYQLANAFI